MRRSRKVAVLAASTALFASVATPPVAFAVAAEDLPTVTAVLETAPEFDDEAGGDTDVDDPAIWPNRKNPAASLVVLAMKNGGLLVTDLAGNQVQRIDVPPPPREDSPEGRFNNVDILENYKFDGRYRDIAVVSDRGRDQIRFYLIDPSAPTGPLVDITVADPPLVFSDDQDGVDQQTTAYGLAVGKVGRRGVVFTSRRERTDVAALTIVERHDRLTYRPWRSWALPAEFAVPGGTWTPCQDEDGPLPQVEGMVYDSANGVLFAGQEQVGIWRIPVARRGEPTLLDRTREFGVPYDREFDDAEEEYSCELRQDEDPGVGGDVLSADVEGLTIAQNSWGRGLLVASSQGDDTFAVYERRGDNRYVGGFRVGDGPATDSVQESDGADVYARPLPGFPRGLLIVQDGDNTPAVLDEAGEERANTNVKFVDWGQVLDTLDRR